MTSAERNLVAMGEDQQRLRDTRSSSSTRARREVRDVGTEVFYLEPEPAGG
jgi:hypothetical protein